MKNQWLYQVLLLLMFLSGSVLAAAPESFDQAKRLAQRLHAPDAESFYCGCDIRWQGNKGIPDLKACGYKVRKNGPRANRIEWEHVMPAHHFGHQRQCWRQGGRSECSKNDAVFRAMEGDLYNLVPAIGEVNGDRSNFSFGMLPQSSSNYGACPVKIDFQQKVVEPREQIRGDIARIYFYMADKYNLNLSRQQQQLFMAWHKQDPVSKQEVALNQRIAQQMGHDNPFISGKKHWVLGYKNSGYGLKADQSLPAKANKATTGKIIGNRNSKLYHLEHCPGFKQVAERNQQWFDSEQQAQKAGFRKAGNCR